MGDRPKMRDPMIGERHEPIVVRPLFRPLRPIEAVGCPYRDRSLS